MAFFIRASVTFGVLRSLLPARHALEQRTAILAPAWRILSRFATCPINILHVLHLLVPHMCLCAGLWATITNFCHPLALLLHRTDLLCDPCMPHNISSLLYASLLAYSPAKAGLDLVLGQVTRASPTGSASEARQHAQQQRVDDGELQGHARHRPRQLVLIGRFARFCDLLLLNHTRGGGRGAAWKNTGMPQCAEQCPTAQHQKSQQWLVQCLAVHQSTFQVDQSSVRHNQT